MRNFTYLLYVALLSGMLTFTFARLSFDVLAISFSITTFVVAGVAIFVQYSNIKKGKVCVYSWATVLCILANCSVLGLSAYLSKATFSLVAVTTVALTAFISWINDKMKTTV
ncbi:hypothetical protein [Bacillus bombysepticus]|uniref:hypothetical protein n=1 Tax=Bacillus bombysepticus TaxID=658666 RepID=UPI003017229B